MRAHLVVTTRASRLLWPAARVLFADGSVVQGLADAVEESKVRAPRSAGSDSVVTDDSRAVRAAIGRLYDPELQASGKDFYDVLEKVGVRPLYGRYLREGPRRATCVEIKFGRPTPSTRRAS